MSNNLDGNIRGSGHRDDPTLGLQNRGNQLQCTKSLMCMAANDPHGSDVVHSDFNFCPAVSASVVFFWGNSSNRE